MRGTADINHIKAEYLSSSTVFLVESLAGKLRSKLLGSHALIIIQIGSDRTEPK